MDLYKLNDFIKGWFVGNFNPSLIKTNDVEIAFKRYKKGEGEAPHYHKIATEITVVCDGEIKMNDNIYKKDDVIVVKPGEVIKFDVLEDSSTIVVKYPGANNDKYVVEQ